MISEWCNYSPTTMDTPRSTTPHVCLGRRNVGGEGHKIIAGSNQRKGFRAKVGGCIVFIDRRTSPGGGGTSTEVSDVYMYSMLYRTVHVQRSGSHNIEQLCVGFIFYLHVSWFNFKCCCRVACGGAFKSIQ